MASAKAQTGELLGPTLVFVVPQRLLGHVALRFQQNNLNFNKGLLPCFSHRSITFAMAYSGITSLRIVK